MKNAWKSASSTPQIPYEVFREILQHLKGNKQSLRAVSLSSAILRQEAQNIIFRNVTTLRTKSRHLKFLQIVAASPSRLALLVRAYRIAPINMSRDLFARIEVGLPAMCNLKHLDVYYIGRTDVKGLDGPVAVLRGCTFKLDTFRWISDYSQASELIETFLPQQDRLRHISLQCNHARALENVRPIDSTISLCPQLISLKAYWDGIRTLLPGHKITALTILHSYTSPSRNIDINSFAPVLKHIKALSYPFEGPDSERFLSHCTSLAVLELRRLDDAENFAILRKIPTLHTLVLSRDRPHSPLLPREQATKFVGRIFDNSSKNLEHIHIQTKVKYPMYEWYARSRGEGDSIPTISGHEVRAMFPN